jgi:hypothetical protein
MSVSAAKMARIKNRELGSNEELREYLTDLRSILYELYIDISFSAEILQSNLRTMKGVKNTLRARVVAGCLRKAAELCKLAAGQTAATWIAFETRYAEELAAAPAKPKVTKFKVV